MTGLLGAVEASKVKASCRKAAETADEYNLSRFRKASKISKASSHPKNSIKKHHRGSNKGIKQRAAKDESDHLCMCSTKLAPSVVEQLVTNSLERKDKIYKATICFRAGGLSEKQLEGCALNIEAKRAQRGSDLVVISDSEEDEPQASGSDMPPLAFTGQLNLNCASAWQRLIGFTIRRVVVVVMVVVVVIFLFHTRHHLPVTISEMHTKRLRL